MEKIIHTNEIIYGIYVDSENLLVELGSLLVRLVKLWDGLVWLYLLVK